MLSKIWNILNFETFFIHIQDKVELINRVKIIVIHHGDVTPSEE